MENLWRKKEKKKIKNLSKDLFGQIGSLKERNSLSSADPAIAIQVGSPKVRFELIHWILPRHFLLISLRFFSDAFSIQILPQITIAESKSKFSNSIKRSENGEKNGMSVRKKRMGGFVFMGSRDWLGIEDRKRERKTSVLVELE